jgi:hypothetical protein
LEFQKGGQLLIGMHHETLSVVMIRFNKFDAFGIPKPAKCFVSTDHRSVISSYDSL